MAAFLSEISCGPIVTRKIGLMAMALLILFTESLNVGFAIRVEEFLAALLPRDFEFGCSDVPIRPTFPGNGT